MRRAELEDRGTTGHGFGHAFHQRELLRARQQPLPRFPWRPIDTGSHVVEDLRHVLDFVEDDRKPNLLQEGARIGAHPGYRVGIFEEVIGGLRKDVPQQSGFAGPAGSGENDRRKRPRRFS